MKILHTSHKGLPDWRVEREALLAKKRGHQVEFLGLGEKKMPFLDAFNKVTMLREINTRAAALDKAIRGEWARAVKEISPDLIHANDIIAAEFSKDLNVPMVYDDHEYWNAQLVVYESWPFWKRLAVRPFVKAVPIWEKDILSNHVTLTVSEGIAEEHRKTCRHVFVLHNYNIHDEVDGLSVNPKRSGVVYAGADLNLKKYGPHRDMTGISDFLEFDVLSGLPRDVLFRKLTQYRIGLIPFHPVPYHRYADSTKAYDYLNCGLQVLMTPIIYESHGRLPYTYPFDSYSELKNVIRDLEQVSPSEIMQYAHENLVWEAQQEQLFEAYRIALEGS